MSSHTPKVNYDLIDFLVENIKVPKKFIESFFQITGDKYSIYQFRINLETAAEWLNIRRDNLKRLLLGLGFEEGSDYIIEIKKILRNNAPGSSNKEIITLTPECFKELCMASNTDRGKQVRRFYLATESLVLDYYNDIQMVKEKKLEICEEHRKKPEKIQSGVIYFFPAQNTLDENVYKVGSTNNINKRFITYNTGNANKVNPAFFLKVNDIKKAESCVKTLLMHDRYDYLVPAYWKRSFQY